jgi:lipopolysaccharide/colanic/teichoic acid biosynthesis glycosyltransferase
MVTLPAQGHQAAVLSPEWSKPLSAAIKRAMDIAISALLLLALLPVLVLLGVLVKISSRGPVFYHWRVAGKNGRPFIGYKFRSMVVNADELKAGLEAENEMTGPVFKLTRDPRVTALGAIMRRYSLDELPQLYSVLKGDMSLVGPRPPLMTEYAHFTEYQKQKLVVTPGMTCLWQVNGRNEVKEFDQWVELDLEYIREWSLKLDFRILCKTVGVVFAGSGK